MVVSIQRIMQTNNVVVRIMYVVDLLLGEQNSPACSIISMQFSKLPGIAAANYVKLSTCID